MQKFTFLLGLLAVCFSLSGQTARIDAQLFDKIRSKGSATFFVMMREQADVSAAKQLRDKETKGNYVFQTLQHTARQSQADIQACLRSKNIGFQSFWAVNGLFVTGNETLVKELAARADVALLTFNHPYQNHKPVDNTQVNGKTLALEWGVQKIKADQVWALGFKGQGVVVGGQDTGYDWEHPALQNQYRGWNSTTATADHNYNWHDAIHQLDSHNTATNPCGFNSLVPCDDDEHGTHTMGTMIGLDGSNQIGVAPEAKWIGCRNMEAGWGTLTTYMESFQWFLAPTDLNDLNPLPAKSPHVINNSWGCPTDEGCDTSNFAVMEVLVNNVRAAGIVVVVSAGNDGPNCHTVQDPPAMYAASFSVGATNMNDKIAGFSSRGTVTVDGSNLRKPDVVAPGVFVNSSIPGGGYNAFSGTSMAGPHVAGAVALLISAHPSLAGQVDSIEYFLKQTAKHITTTDACGGESATAIPNNTYGYGRIDILAAVNLANTPASAIENTAVSAFELLPNPADNELKIVSATFNGDCQLWMYAADGKCVLSQTTSPNQSVDISKLASGLYTCKIIANGKVMTQKIWVK